MILRAISKFNWRSRTYEVGAIITDADDAKALQMIKEGLVVEEQALPASEPLAVHVEQAAPKSEPVAEPEPAAGDPVKPSPAKKKSKSKKK